MPKKLLIHAGFWFAILMISLALTMNNHSPDSLLFEGICLVLYALVFYINILFLFPKFYEKSRTVYYVTSFILIVFAFLIIHGMGELIFNHHDHGYDRRHGRSREDFLMVLISFRYLFWLALIYMVGTVYSIQHMLNQQIARNKKMMEEKLQTELQLLKAQINPHFLFNALNNVYSLTYMKSDKASESVLKLSEMLRYVIEDCSAEKVPLRNEMDYLTNLIEFYKLKSPGKRKITFRQEIGNPDVMIVPMLFMPFMENSFKYSRIEEDRSGFIELELREASGILHFTVRNSIFSERTIQKGSGQGIANVRHRLNILYPDQYRLSTERKDDVFIVELEIRLK